MFSSNTVENQKDKSGFVKLRQEKEGSLSLKYQTGVRSILEDSKGNIWFGTRDNGVWRYNENGLTNFGIKEGLTSSFVTEIYEDKSGSILLGMTDGSVCKYINNRFEKVF